MSEHTSQLAIILPQKPPKTLESLTRIQAHPAWLADNEQITNNFAPYGDISDFPKGPWTTKSNAILSVLFAQSQENLSLKQDPFELQLHHSGLFEYDQTELDHLPNYNIRGLRAYTVRDINPGEVGGLEYHRIRHELLFCTKGEVLFRLTDVQDNQETIELTPGQGIVIDPFIVHTYVAIQPSDLFVLCNTLYDPQNPISHDTFSQEEFRELQHLYQRQ